MKPIRIFTPSTQMVAEIDNYEYLSMTRRWHSVGEIELRINRYKKKVDQLTKNSIIVPDKEPHKAFIIKHREIELDANGKVTENWLIKGYSLQGIVGQRVTVPPSTTAYDNKSGPAETVMKHYVNNHVVNPVDINRKIDQVSISLDQGRGSSISWQSRFKNLAEELTNISFATGLGWNVYMDLEQKKWVFEVYDGRDLSVNQNINKKVIFSPEFESIKTQSFSDSDVNFKNFGYVGGQGEGEARDIVGVGDASGLSRLETFIDARDVEDIALLPDRGQQKLNEFAVEQFFEGQILTKSPFVYGKDWDLGDIATLQNRGWGVTMDSRITEVKEIYEPSGFQLEATFGKSRPTLISKLKQKFDEIEPLIKR